jgi:hypothetical protein
LAPQGAAGAADFVASLDAPQRSDFLEFAGTHHVVVRALRALRLLAGDRNGLSHWIGLSLEAEQSRVDNALPHLERICRLLQAAGCPVAAIKSLYHYPDLGNDLDLYTTAEEPLVCEVMVRELRARVMPQSWGDRLAHKWNFAIPGLREWVEIHCRRLGQTGEQVGIARRLVERRVLRFVQGFTLPVPAPEERILLAVLQRMCRQFYFRICDVTNSAELVESGAVDLDELRRAAELGGIWPGTVTYLKIVSEYAGKYRGHAVELPVEVLRTARFGPEKLFLLRQFLRVPIVPQGAGLYTRQVASTARRGDVPAILRLSLLPPLAATAAVAFKVTGDDKGIW